jgi:hypothetical protein
MARNLLSPLPTPRDSITGRRSGCPLRSLPPVTVRAGIPPLIVIRRYPVRAPSAFAITPRLRYSAWSRSCPIPDSDSPHV